MLFLHFRTKKFDYTIVSPVYFTSTCTQTCSYELKPSGHPLFACMHTHIHTYTHTCIHTLHDHTYKQTHILTIDLRGKV